MKKLVEPFGNDIWFYCPGCKTNHRVTKPRWTWNNRTDRPTITPSLITDPDGPRHCHLNITDGKIIYHGDCKHSLVGQTVEMESINDS